MSEATQFIKSLSAEQIETASHIAFDQFRARNPTTPLPDTARLIFMIGFVAGCSYGADLAGQLQEKSSCR